jgi:hypothetical protein
MSGASISHTTWSTYLFRLLVLLASALVLVMLSAGQARADGLGGVTAAVGDSVGSVVTATTGAADEVVSSTSETVQQTAATVGTATLDAVSSTTAVLDRVTSSAARTIHHVLRSAGRATNGDDGGHGTPIPLPAVAQTVPGQPAGPPHPHHHEHHGQHGVPPSHHGVGVSPTPVTTDVVRTTLQRSNEAPAAATEGPGPAPSPRGRPVPRGSSGGATVPVGGGLRDPGGRGGQLAAILVAALVLARSSSRWLRLLAVARGPTPIVPILAPPG